MINEEPAGRRRFIATASAAAAATIVPRHVLGGPGFVAPSDKVNVALVGAGGQGLHNVRALFQESDCQVIAVADPAEEWDLREFYYGGRSGRGPVRAEIEEHYRATTPNHACAVVRGLPRDAGKGEVRSTPCSSPPRTTCTRTSRSSR